MLLSQLAIVFVGIAGNHHEVVEHQLAPVLEKAGVNELVIPDGDVGTLARHNDQSRAIVRALHVDGVIGGALVKANGVLNFRLVIFDGDGNLKSLGETPLTKNKLSKDDLEVFGMNLDEELSGLAKHHPAVKPEPAPAPAPKPEPQKPIKVAMNTPPRATAAAAPHALAEINFDSDETPPNLGPAPTKRDAKKPAPPAPVPATHDDDEAPPGLAAAKPKQLAAPAPKHDEAPAEAHHDAAPTETADAVSLDDIEAATGTGETVDGGSATATTIAAASTLHLHAGLTLGLAGRVFAPGTAAVTGYSSNPVGAAGFEVGVAPTARTSLSASAERTIQMSSAVSDGMASTAMTRWQVEGNYALTRGAIVIAPTVGVGHRSFSIDSTDPSRSPDGDYTYLVLGATIAKPIGSSLTLRGLAAFEPVVGGVEPTEMAFGDASRWALDVGASLELHLRTHVFARAAVEYQRFQLSWDAAGARGAGGAADSYPSGTLSLGADY
jgi:hypothetical protein